MNAACSMEGRILDVALPLSSSSSLPVSLSSSAHERRTSWESRTSRGQSTTPTAPTPSTVVHKEEWLEWLLVKICVEEMFEILFTTLGSIDGVGQSGGDESGNGSPIYRGRTYISANFDFSCIMRSYYFVGHPLLKE